MNIFVFGSNLAGRHGAGAALCARRHHGAIYGQGVGLQGWSYAIPTKDENMRTLPLSRIRMYVINFLRHATQHSEDTFQVTRIGCGLAGYKDADIAPFFRGAPSNCNLPDGWATPLNAVGQGELSALDDELEDTPPECWYISFGQYGQITLRQDEAQRAADAGAKVWKYATGAMVPANKEN